MKRYLEVNLMLAGKQCQPTYGNMNIVCNCEILNVHVLYCLISRHHCNINIDSCSVYFSTRNVTCVTSLDYRVIMPLLHR